MPIFYCWKEEDNQDVQEGLLDPFTVKEFDEEEAAKKFASYYWSDWDYCEYQNVFVATSEHDSVAEDVAKAKLFQVRAVQDVSFIASKVD